MQKHLLFLYLKKKISRCKGSLLTLLSVIMIKYDIGYRKDGAIVVERMTDEVLINTKEGRL